MQPPDELMVKEFLPAIRQLVTRELRTQGFSQNKISGLLGITQASVSLYLSSAPSKAYASLSEFAVPASDADRYAAMLAEDVKRRPVDAVRTLNAVWTSLLGTGAVCASHRSLYPTLADCDVCIKEYGQRRGSQAKTVSEVSEAVGLLEASQVFAAIMPEVSVNLVCAPDDAKSASDVVAVPGRIVRVKGRARAILPPEAGASAHMARVLLMAREFRPEFRACINLRYDKKMELTLKRLGLRRLRIGGYAFSKADDPTAEAMRFRLRDTPGRFDAIVDAGGSGIEPNVYLFADGAKGVAKLALRVARAYSAS